MVNKQGILFLTLTSLILVLSVYYITMPNELLITANGNYQKEVNKNNINKEKVNVSIKEGNKIEVMKAILKDSRLTLTKELNDKLVSSKLSVDERNKVYDRLKSIAKIEGMEEIIIQKIKEEYKLDSYAKIEDDVVEIVVNSKIHDTNLVVKIMKSVQEEFEKPMYISVSFKE